MIRSKELIDYRLVACLILFVPLCLSSCTPFSENPATTEIGSGSVAAPEPADGTMPNQNQVILSPVGNFTPATVLQNLSVFRTIENMPWLYSIAWSPNGDRIATATGDVNSNVSRVLIWEIETGELILSLDTESQ